MADNNQENEGKDEDLAKRAKRKKLLIIVGGLTLIGLIGGGASYFLMSSNSNGKTAPSTPEADKIAQSEHATSQALEKKPETDHKAGEVKDQANSAHDKQKTETSDTKSKEQAITSNSDSEVNIDFGQTYALKPFHFNLGNPLENRYIRLEVALEYRSGASQKKEIEARLPQLRDAIISVASRKTREFLLGPDGKDQLRLEILNRINQYMDRKIEAVYIVDILIE